MTVSAGRKAASSVVASLSHLPYYFLQPARLFRLYDRRHLQADFVAGLTVGLILVPQGIAAALLAELPATMGLYSAIVGAIVGALWGSSNQMHTGPNNAISLLVFSVLMTIVSPGSPEFVIAAGMMAVMVGLFQLVMGAARLGFLVNFVSYSVVVGFTAGAGVLIGTSQLRHLLGVQGAGHSVLENLRDVSTHLLETDAPTALLGLGTIALIVALRQLRPHFPAVPVSLAVAAAAVYVFRPEGVSVVGQIPGGLPPVTPLWQHLNLQFIANLSTGSLAVSAISLVATSAIARSLSAQTGQRVSSNQEFIGQGLANIACGFFSGYVGAGSFSRSVVNMRAGAQTRMSALLSGVFVLIALPFLSPVLVYLPRAAIAGVLVVAALGMIDRAEIARIWRGARDDALIMAVTFLATLLLSLEFAVLTGIFLSFVVYVFKTSVPRVVTVLPDENYRHLVPRPDKPPCPQLAIIDVFGDLYFGAVGHVERAIFRHMTAHPEQRYLLLRMRSVNQCDFSGIHALETIVHAYRDRGGDVFLVRVAEPILELMKTTGFYRYLGADHFLPEDEAVSYIFYNVLDPVVCIYECEVRAFLECQNLPKQIYPLAIPLAAGVPLNGTHRVSPRELWEQLRSKHPPLVIDVREPREFRKGHIPEAQLRPLGKLLTSDRLDLPPDTPVVLVCRTNRRSLRAAYALREHGLQNIRILEGGMQAWEAAGLLEAVEM